MSAETPDPRLDAFQATLAQLKPLAGTLDRDQLLFRAGQASVRRCPWLWPAATAAAMLLAVGLGVALLLRPTPQLMIVGVHEPAPAPELPSSPPGERGPRPEYLWLRDQIVLRGVESLPPPPPVGEIEPVPTVKNLLDL